MPAVTLRRWTFLSDPTTRTTLPALLLHDRLLGHEDGVGAGAHQESHLRVLPGEQQALAIGHRRPHLEGARRRIDRIVDEVDATRLGVRRLARHRHGHGEAAGALGQKVSRVALGDGEVDVDRVELDDGGEQRALAGAHEIAHVDLPAPDAAGHRRVHRRVAQVQLRLA